MKGSMKVALLAFTLLVINGTLFLKAQSSSEQSTIIFRLVSHVEWPEKADSFKFIIGVLGIEADFMAFQQKAWEQGSINSKVIEVRFFKCTDNLGQCDLVYVSENCTSKLDHILKATRNEPILIVTGKEGYGKLGSVINFVESDGKVLIELNEKEAVKRGLELSAVLKEIAVVI